MANHFSIILFIGVSKNSPVTSTLPGQGSNSILSQLQAFTKLHLTHTRVSHIWVFSSSLCSRWNSEKPLHTFYFIHVMLSQDYNVWCSPSVTQQTLNGQEWALGLFFYHPLHSQVPPRAAAAGDGTGRTHTSISLPFFLWTPRLLFGKSSVNPHKVLGKGSSNRMHKFLSTNWQLLHLWWRGRVQKHFCFCLAILPFALALKRGKGSTLHPQTPHRANLTVQKWQKPFSQWHSSWCLHNCFQFQRLRFFHLLTLPTTPWFRWDRAPGSPEGASGSLTQVSLELQAALHYIFNSEVTRATKYLPAAHSQSHRLSPCHKRKR